MLNCRQLIGATAILSAKTALASATSAQSQSAQVAPPVLRDVEFMTPDHPGNGPNFNAFNAPTFKMPALRALCHSREAVGDVVRWARAEGISFAIRSTGHDFCGHSQHDELVIDTSPLNSIELLDNAQLVRTGAGARNGAVSLHLAQHDRILGGGTYELVGMAGVTLGGGFGYFARLTGLLCDQLESLTLVDAEGDILSVNEQTDPDLFWACKGAGGGSLGIVTDLTYRTLEVPRLTYVTAPLIVDALTAAHLLHDWQHWVAALPRSTNTHVNVSWYVDGQVILNVSGMSLEPGEQVKAALQHWVGNRAVIADQWIRYDTSAVIMEGLYGVPHYVSSLEYYARSQTIAEPLALGDVALLLHTLGSYPAGAVDLNFEALGGASEDVAADATAFPHRSAAYIVHVTKSILDGSTREASLAALEATAGLLGEHATGGIYVNYPECDLQDWPSAYWGSNLERLRAVKRRVDPDNVFRHAQSVPV